MTRAELVRVYNQVKHCKIGYCCYQDAGKSIYKLINLGSNSGIYGWNWTAYLDPETDTLYISDYRNVPNYLVEK